MSLTLIVILNVALGLAVTASLAACILVASQLADERRWHPGWDEETETLPKWPPDWGSRRLADPSELAHAA